MGNRKTSTVRIFPSSGHPTICRPLDAGKEVKRWGEPVTLPEMNAHDRRIIHVTLQDDPELETRSEGEGALKKVIISLKKAE